MITLLERIEGINHMQRVADMTARLAAMFDIENREIVRAGSLLHDVGKLVIPERILLKRSELTPNERAIVQMHTVYGYRLLASSDYLLPLADIPYCHHEKWDGTGYPRGLKGEEIPLAARIFAVVDVYDALTSDRPYRLAWPHEKAMAYIRDESGRHFDPKVVEAFLEMLKGGRL